MVERKEAVQAVVAALQGIQMRVGVVDAPDDGGWEHGQPNVGRFIPYAVVLPGPATPKPTVKMRHACTTWESVIRVRVHALSWETVEDMLEAAVGVLEPLKPAGNALVMQQVGDVRHDTSVTPHMFSGELVARVWMSGTL